MTDAPSNHEIELVKTYLNELNNYRTVPKKPLCDQLVIDAAPMVLVWIEKFGNGDPIKAARKHARVMVKVHQPATEEDTIH